MKNWFTGMSDRHVDAASSGRARLPEVREGRYPLPAEGDVR